MAVILPRFLRVLQLLVIFYAFLAVLYTTNLLLVSPLHFRLSRVLTSSFAKERGVSWSALSLGLSSDRTVSLPGPSNIPGRMNTDSGNMLWEPSKDLIYWTPSDVSLRYDLGRATTVAITEGLFLSKAFAQSMRLSKIVPFFYRATGVFDRDDITITTLITSNRFKVFAPLVERYEGPISVAIHVKNITSHIHDLLDDLHNMYISMPHMSTNVDVHLVIDSFDRQFNAWRNIARLFARTDFVMMLDVDFAICTDFRKAIRGSSVVMDKLREGNSAFVVPAFEYRKHSDGLDQKTFPRNKESLLSLVEAKRIDMFHASWPAGHNSTEYERYYAAHPGEVYKVTRYQPAYEPYVIFKKEGPPWCDERFIGYGGNKAACLFEMYLSGISYYVLTDHFLVHQNHLYEEVVRKNERKYNRKVYTDFREETCLRYLKSYHDHGILNTTQGFNVLEECKNIKGVSKLGSQLFG